MIACKVFVSRCHTDGFETAPWICARERSRYVSIISLRRDRELAANQELARLHAALVDSDRHNDAFIEFLAHDLRDPLAPTRTAIDLWHRW